MAANTMLPAIAVDSDFGAPTSVPGPVPAGEVSAFEQVLNSDTTASLPSTPGPQVHLMPPRSP